MCQRTRPMLLAVLLALLVLAPSASAGRYETLLEMINEVEQRIAALEEAQQDHARQIDQRLSQIVPGSAGVDPAQLEDMAVGLDALGDLAARVAALEGNLHDLQAQYQAQLEDEAARDALAAAITDWTERLDRIEARWSEDNLRFAATETSGLGWQPAPTISAFEPPLADAPAADDGPALEISGFGDLVYEVREEQAGGDQEQYGIGQAEVDLASTFDDRIGIEAAIAFNPDDSQFELGAFFVDFHLWGREEGHFKTVPSVSSSGLIVGQFDVPFGIDWQQYPSIDRRLVSAPLVVDNTHGAWNDLGVQGYMATDFFNAVAFVTNGFEHYTECEGLCASPFDLESQRAFGARLGITPVPGIEIGGSYSYLPSRGLDDISDLTPNRMSLLGADLQWAHGPLSFRGEYIAHGVQLEVSEEAGTHTTYDQNHTGFYTEAMYDFSRYFLIARFDRYSPDLAGAGDVDRVSTGGGWVVNENCELRIEYQASSEENESVAYMQAVVGF